VIKALGTSENNFSTLGSPATFLRYVSMEKSVRDASTEANQKMDAFEIEQSMREDVYEAVKRAVQQTRVDSLSEEDKRLMNKIELEFKRNGNTLYNILIIRIGFTRRQANSFKTTSTTII
jgi:Zn-dependent oligopeptidase